MAVVDFIAVLTRCFVHLILAFFVCLSRGREVKKSGGGGRNWGNDNAADVDSAAANTNENNEGEGAGWGANGAAPAPNAEVNLLSSVDLVFGGVLAYCWTGWCCFFVVL